jgi:hypothetical protein
LQILELPYVLDDRPSNPVRGYGPDKNGTAFLRGTIAIKEIKTSLYMSAWSKKLFVSYKLVLSADPSEILLDDLDDDLLPDDGDEV